ncbi:MAG: biotin--[acetyl-CoA-carboxylase] ligase [Acidobacteria bacterium]|nr:biotin--[acetyl-CoA-carboxylase] ligase [Acidobacteriota bacterium]
MNFTILRFDTLDSTNTEALNEARLGADEGLTIVAKRQTAGRGRNGRTWISAENSGLYVSVVLRPRIEMRLVPLITLLTAVAVSDVLRENYKLDPDIKWVNDVHVGGKKICGILAELTETRTGPAIVVGIGINLRSSNFPPELAGIATSIEVETGKVTTADELLDGLLGFFGYLYDRFGDEPGFVIDEWAARSSYFRGKQVRVATGGETVTGVTDGLEHNGALRVRTESGEVRIVQAGDVEQLR